MAFRLGAVVGFGVGSYLGAKAGRERYEQLRAVIDGLRPAERAHAVLELAQERLHVMRHSDVVIPPHSN
jgi:hypothetical protein